MNKYHKIETVFVRDTTGTKKLIEGAYCNPIVEYLANNKWEFTEKIDGTNIRIHWDGYNIEFGGRTERSQIPNHLLKALNDIFMNDATEQIFEQEFGEHDVILFGEGYGHKIQKGDLYRSDVGFILFDVMIDGNYQNRHYVETIAACFNLEIVPVILRGTIQDAVDFVKSNPDSTIGTAKMEGLVGRPMYELNNRCGKRVIVKIKTCDFEVNKND